MILIIIYLSRELESNDRDMEQEYVLESENILLEFFIPAGIF